MKTEPTLLKTGDILLYHSHTLIGKLIRYFSKSYYSHAAIVFDSWGAVLVAEADSKGVIPNRVKHSIKGCEILVLRPKFEVDPKQLDVMITLELGKHKYNFFLLIVMQLIYQLSNKKVWIYWGENGRKLRKTVCGQFCAYIYNEYNGKFPDWAKATPQSLFESDLFEHINP